MGVHERIEPWSRGKIPSLHQGILRHHRDNMKKCTLEILYNIIRAQYNL